MQVLNMYNHQIWWTYGDVDDGDNNDDDDNDIDDEDDSDDNDDDLWFTFWWNRYFSYKTEYIYMILLYFWV